jgi:hypothetical protein
VLNSRVSCADDARVYANADAVDRIGRSRWPGVLLVGLLVAMVSTAGFATVRGAMAAGSSLAGTRTVAMPADLATEVGPGARPVAQGADLRIGSTERGPVQITVSFSVVDVPAGARVVHASLRMRRVATAPDVRAYHAVPSSDQGAALLSDAVVQNTGTAAGVVVDPGDDQEWMEFDVTADVGEALGRGTGTFGWTLVDAGAKVGPAHVVIVAPLGSPEGPELLISYGR